MNVNIAIGGIVDCDAVCECGKIALVCVVNFAAGLLYYCADCLMVSVPASIATMIIRLKFHMTENEFEKVKSHYPEKWVGLKEFVRATEIWNRPPAPIVTDEVFA